MFTAANVGKKISIHAPRMGSDEFAHAMSKADTNFNPRSPHGERLELKRQRDDAEVISIHAPRMGSDPRASLS